MFLECGWEPLREVGKHLAEGPLAGIQTQNIFAARQQCHLKHNKTSMDCIEVCCLNHFNIGPYLRGVNTFASTVLEFYVLH